MSAVLERRYRRLLAWYPADHRAEYEQEMLGVLMAGARPGQRMPALGEALDLLLSATRRRLGRLRPGPVDPRWRDAAAVCGVAAAILLLGRQLRPLATGLGWHLRGGGTGPLFPLDSSRPWTGWPAIWLSAALWSVVVAAVLLRRRRVTVAVAWLAALMDVAVVVVTSPSDYSMPFGLFVWSAILSVIAAVLLSVPGRGLAVLGGRRVAVLGLAGLVAAASPIVEVYLWKRLDDIWLIESNLHTWLGLGTQGIVLLMAFGTVATVPGPVRRRVLTLAATFGTLLLMRMAAGYQLTVTMYLEATPVRLLTLLPLPLAVFLTGVLVVRRRDRPQ